MDSKIRGGILLSLKRSVAMRERESRQENADSSVRLALCYRRFTRLPSGGPCTGSNSAIRQKHLPNSKRAFSGYVAWRGTVPESEISDKVCKVFEKNVTLNLMKDDHALM